MPRGGSSLENTTGVPLTRTTWPAYLPKTVRGQRRAQLGAADEEAGF